MTNEKLREFKKEPWDEGDYFVGKPDYGLVRGSEADEICRVMNSRWGQKFLASREEEVRKLIIDADSKLSLLRHRGNIQWGAVGMVEAQEVDEVIGRLRRHAALLSPNKDENPDLSA